MSWLVAFGRFWYDFIVGDSAILAIGAVGSVAVTALLVRAGAGALTPATLPLLIASALATSLRWPR
jgi:hypothetical protein